MDLSIVIPVYNEVEALPSLYVALVETLDRLNKSAEIIFANDGSTDGSGPCLDDFAAKDPRVRVLHLSRNYGQTAALMAAIQNSSGDVIIPMDGDGQNDPADIPRLLDKLNEGFDVVSGWRTAREDAALSRRLPSILANRLISRVLRVQLHDYGCTLKVYRREVVEDVRLYGEMHRFIPIYAAWEGASVAELPVGHHPRRFGKSKYGLARVARVLHDPPDIVGRLAAGLEIGAHLHLGHDAEQQEQNARKADRRCEQRQRRLDQRDVIGIFQHHRPAEAPE